MFGSGSVRAIRRDTAPIASVDAFEAAYDRTFPIVYRFVYRGTHNANDAEDLTSETYERALRNLPRFRGSADDLDGWVFGIARNVLREWWRDRERRHAPLTTQHEVTLAADPGEPTSSRPSLASLVGSLTPTQREVLEMRLSGLKVREVALALGKAEGTVKALQFAALRNLRKAANVT